MCVSWRSASLGVRRFDWVSSSTGAAGRSALPLRQRQRRATRSSSDVTRCGSGVLHGAVPVTSFSEQQRAQYTAAQPGSRRCVSGIASTTGGAGTRSSDATAAAPAASLLARARVGLLSYALGFRLLAQDAALAASVLRDPAPRAAAHVRATAGDLALLLPFIALIVIPGTAPIILLLLRCAAPPSHGRVCDVAAGGWRRYVPACLPRQFRQDLGAFVREADAAPAPRGVLAAAAAAVTLTTPPVEAAGAAYADAAAARVLTLVRRRTPTERDAALRAVVAAAPACLAAAWVGRCSDALAAVRALTPALAPAACASELVALDRALARADALARSGGVAAMSDSEVAEACAARGLRASGGNGAEPAALRRELSRWLDMTVCAGA